MLGMRCRRAGWKAHKTACAAHKKGLQYLAHFDVDGETTKHASWCAPLINTLSKSKTRSPYLVESLKAMEEVFNHPIRLSAIFCSSGDYAKRGQREMWKLTRSYVEDGGRFLLGGPGVSHMRHDAINEMMSGLGLSWGMYEYMRTTHFRNDANPLFASLPAKAAARTLLPKSYSMKSIVLKGVADQDALYRSTSESKVESIAMLMGGGEVIPGEVGAATTKVGQGWISWIGDVNQEEGSNHTACFLLGLEAYR
ncbi:hypothetical protein JCM10908_002868 [Rhodotorula pacifica]|uniref:uncharacterized protein n=1 Tax=Rhodotorula pacifica TaxID=1495444 RepID=UPI00316E7B27